MKFMCIAIIQLNTNGRILWISFKLSCLFLLGQSFYCIHGLLQITFLWIDLTVVIQPILVIRYCVGVTIKLGGSLYQAINIVYGNIFYENRCIICPWLYFLYIFLLWLCYETEGIIIIWFVSILLLWCFEQHETY